MLSSSSSSSSCTYRRHPSSSPPTASVPTPPAPPPPVSERPTRGAATANRNLAPPPQPPTHPGHKIQPPTSTPANQNAGSTIRPRRSARLNPGLHQACTIKDPPGTRASQSQHISKMARTYPLSLEFNQCLGAKEEPYSFSSVYLEDLRNGDMEYLSTIEQLVNALPKMMDSASRFAFCGHVTTTGHQRLCHSMRAALWWLLRRMGSSVGHHTLSITTSHARDGAWSCEGVMSPNRFMRVE